jgi:hypothetical protein
MSSLLLLPPLHWKQSVCRFLECGFRLWSEGLCDRLGAAIPQMLHHKGGTLSRFKNQLAKAVWHSTIIDHSMIPLCYNAVLFKNRERHFFQPFFRNTFI